MININIGPVLVPHSLMGNYIKAHRVYEEKPKDIDISFKFHRRGEVSSGGKEPEGVLSRRDRPCGFFQQPSVRLRGCS